MSPSNHTRIPPHHSTKPRQDPLRQQTPRRPARRTQNTKHQQRPIQDPLAPRDILSANLEIERQWQNHTDAETQKAAEQRHDAVKAREPDGDRDKHNVREDAHQDLSKPPGRRRGGRTIGVRERDRALIEPKHRFQRNQDRARVERHLCQRNDGDEHHNEHVENLRVGGDAEYAGCDFVAHLVAKHEDTNHREEEIEAVCEEVRDVDRAVVLVGVTHIFIDVGEHAVTAPGSYTMLAWE